MGTQPPIEGNVHGRPVQSSLTFDWARNKLNWADPVSQSLTVRFSCRIKICYFTFVVSFRGPHWFCRSKFYSQLNIAVWFWLHLSSMPGNYGHSNNGDPFRLGGAPRKNLWDQLPFGAQGIKRKYSDEDLVLSGPSTSTVSGLPWICDRFSVDKVGFSRAGSGGCRVLGQASASRRGNGTGHFHGLRRLLCTGNDCRSSYLSIHVVFSHGKTDVCLQSGGILRIDIDGRLIAARLLQFPRIPVLKRMGTGDRGGVAYFVAVWF